MLYTSPNYKLVQDEFIYIQNIVNGSKIFLGRGNIAQSDFIVEKQHITISIPEKITIYLYEFPRDRLFLTGYNTVFNINTMKTYSSMLCTGIDNFFITEGAYLISTQDTLFRMDINGEIGPFKNKKDFTVNDKIYWKKREEGNNILYKRDKLTVSIST